MKECQNPNCATKGKLQPLENFHKVDGTKDGLSKICRICEMEKNQKGRNQEFKGYTGECYWKDQSCAEGIKSQDC